MHSGDPMFDSAKEMEVIEKELKGKNVENNEKLTAKPLIAQSQGSLISLEKQGIDPWSSHW